MRRAIVSFVTIFSFLAGCSDLSEAPDNDFANYTGTIAVVNSVYLIQSDQAIENAHTVLPTNLPAAFQENGLRIAFSGRIDALPYVMYHYLPIKLSAIRRLDGPWVFIR